MVDKFYQTKEANAKIEKEIKKSKNKERIKLLKSYLNHNNDILDKCRLYCSSDRGNMYRGSIKYDGWYASEEILDRFISEFKDKLKGSEETTCTINKSKLDEIESMEIKRV